MINEKIKEYTNFIDQNRLLAEYIIRNNLSREKIIELKGNMENFYIRFLSDNYLISL